ncbi:MAG: hypothetical protein QM784_11640 [Polyangiaceae bacterium]
MYSETIERAHELSCELPDEMPVGTEAIPTRFQLFRDDQISVTYAPFDYINRTARILILGITPGWRQARIAFETAISMRGCASDTVGVEVKRRAAFAGSMRQNLISMLDELGVPGFLGIETTAQMFAERSDLLHSTSALRYPVFKHGANFSGYDPNPTQHPFLSSMLEHLLVPELAAVPQALVIPLGGSVESVLDYLVATERLAGARWLRGFPHPSGANGHRKRMFEARKNELAAAAKRWLGGRNTELP